jgi:hypothetical protein
MSSRIQLNIDRLVLRGVDPSNRAALVSAMKSELARILADPATRSAISRSRQTPFLRLGNITFEPGPAGARALGRNVGRSIGRGLQK